MTSFDTSIPAPKRMMAIPAPAKTWANPFTEKKPTTEAKKIAQVKRRYDILFCVLMSLVMLFFLQR